MISKVRTIFNHDIFFPISIWLSSRLIIIIAMLIIAPLLPTPSNGVAATFSWDVFSAWDSGWYEKIATLGYASQGDSIKEIDAFAFFPLFPLLSRLVMTMGIPFKVAAVLVNNLAFLSASIILYLWVAESYGKNTARWIIAFFTYCPYSIYGTVIYTEGLFLLCTTASLRAFDRKQHTLAAFWGALSTATRVPGITLIPAFLFVSWRERRGIKAYIASFAVGLGILLYILYCQIQFGDGLAFVHAQKAWRHDASGFAWEGWWTILMQITIGHTNLKYGYIKEIWHPLLFLIIIISGYLLWKFHIRLGSVRSQYSFYFLWLLLWLLTGDELVKSTLIFVGLYLLFLYRNRISLVTVIYGFLSYTLILNTGITASIERYIYGIISVSIAFGLLFSKFDRFIYPMIYFFALLLVTFSLRFVHHFWVA